MLGRARKSLLLTAGVLGALFTLTLGSLAVLLWTTVGARASLAVLADLIPGELVVGRVGGSIAGGLLLADVRYESPELAGTLARLQIDPQLDELLHRRVVLSRLVAEHGTIALRETDPAPAEPVDEPRALPEIPEWLVVRSLRVRDVTLAGGADAVIARLDASVTGSRIAINALEVQAGGGNIEASGHARINGDATARIEGSWVMSSASSDAATPGDLRIELGADIELAANTLPWRATLRWDRLAVQAAGTQWSSPMGRLTLTLGTTPIELELTANLANSPLPTTATISGFARLTGNTLDLGELAVDTLGGRIVAHGAADLGARAGHAAVEYSMLDPTLVDPRLEGSLRGTASAAFAFEPEIVVGAAAALSGTLGGRPVEGALRARMQGGVAHIDRARVTLEQSVVELAGRISDDTIEFAFDVELPELENWYPSAAGSLRANGSLSGVATNPTIDVQLAGADVQIEALPPVEELSLDVSGTLSAHDARLSASSPYGAVTMRVGQGWSGKRLAGTVLESRFALQRGGDWTQSAPAEYAVAGPTAELASLCYAGPEHAQLCVMVGDNTLRLDASGVPSSLAEPWLGGVRLEGAADFDLTVGWRPALHGSFALTQPTLRVQPQGEASAGEPAPGDLASIDDLSVTATLTEQSLDARLTASLAATGDPLEAQVALAPPTAEGMLDATVSAQLTNLELVDALIEDVEELTGSLTVDLRATGSLSEPELDGELALRSVQAFVPRLGIEVAEGRLTAQPAGLGAVDFTAALCSIGCVELDGSLDLRAEAAAWHATAELTGDSFELADLGQLRAVIAPDLVLDATPAAWRVTGQLAIEEGLLAVEAVPRSAVRPVPETVVHGRDEVAAPEELPVPLVADIDLLLGDVRFEGLGIAAQLEGLLDIERTIDGRLFVNGTASIEEGTFSAYSQELMIERGDLLFAGPSDNPALDVRATREVEGATVGLAVSGTLRDPQSEVFSMPLLTESEALARLVTGRSLESAGTADAEAIERAALGLGIRRALPALERIGSNLGLDELGVDSGGGEDSALVAGRQLGEDVYLRYKHGLFDDFAGLELIYRITERFRLRTETGTSRSIDLLYERNRQEGAPLAETNSSFEDAEARPAPGSDGPTESQ